MGISYEYNDYVMGCQRIPYWSDLTTWELVNLNTGELVDSFVGNFSFIWLKLIKN